MTKLEQLKKGFRARPQRLTREQRGLLWTSKQLARIRPELRVRSEPMNRLPALRVVTLVNANMNFLWAAINRRGVPVPKLKKYFK